MKSSPPLREGKIIRDYYSSEGCHIMINDAYIPDGPREPYEQRLSDLIWRLWEAQEREKQFKLATNEP